MIQAIAPRSGKKYRQVPDQVGKDQLGMSFRKGKLMQQTEYRKHVNRDDQCGGSGS